MSDFNMTRRQIMAAATAGVAAGPLAALPNGYYVPAEEVAHQATFMQWPNARAVYEDPVFLDMTQDAIAQIANTVSEFEPVIMLAAAQHHSDIRRRVSGDITLWDIPTEGLWARDSGPLFATNDQGDQQIVSLNFNGWGRKQVHAKDKLVAQKVADRLGLPLFKADVTGEPGGVDQDGDGLLIAHESSWVNRNRNRGHRLEIENALLDAYGAERMIWAPGVKGEDITDDHIDSQARFYAPGRVIVQIPDKINDIWDQSAWQTHDVLKGARMKVRTIKSPLKTRVKHLEFVASYVNYYVCNGAVICAQFGDPERDAAAQSVLRKSYPDREIVALNVDPLGELGGGIHCATQQWPA